MSTAGTSLFRRIGALRQDRRGTLQSQVLQTYSELPHKNLQVSGYVVKPFLCCVCVCVQSYECGRDGDKQDTVDEFWRVFVGPKAGSYDLRTRAPKRTFPSFPPHSWVLR